ncbi:MAG: TadE/TadG family type IV pilus assembly protein [Anaerolineales bacterium]|nr:MAG: TadE/TadG family type IV pilus assembly protein [Anaerolineales bacterium]
MHLAAPQAGKMIKLSEFGITKKITNKLARLPRKTKAQSLTEFAIALPVLFLLLSGVIEFGFALNYYLSLLDATREAARFYSNGDPFLRDSSDNITGDNMQFYGDTADMVRANLDPSIIIGNESYAGRKITLDSAADDVIVTVYTKDDSDVVRYPTSGPYQVYGHATTMFTTTDIQNDFLSNSPNAGILVVEVHYNYHQVMKLPWLTPFVPDPFVLTAYTMMPVVAAEPVETGP